MCMGLNPRPGACPGCSRRLTSIFWLRTASTVILLLNGRADWPLAGATSLVPATLLLALLATMLHVLLHCCPAAR